MYRSPIVTLLFVGIFTPAIRATLYLSCPSADPPSLYCPKGLECAHATQTPYGVTPKRGTIVSPRLESTTPSQFPVIRSRRGSICQNLLDLPRHFFHGSHSVDRPEHAATRIVREDWCGLLM